jgi:transposase
MRSGCWPTGAIEPVSATGSSEPARADWFTDALQDKGIKPCIPGRKSRGKPITHDKRRDKRRNRIEIMFGRLEDWRRVATRYDRCPKDFLSAAALAATVMLWL